MKLQLLNATICDPQSPWNGKKCDLFINNGIIENIRSASKQSAAGAGKAWDLKGALLSPGWFDMRTALREPGHEYKEDLVSLANAAAAGGFTSIACLPSSYPVVQTKADIEFIYRKAEKLPVHIFPYGAITRDRDGRDLNELYDMHQAGAVAFTDGNKTLMHAGLMMRAMMYARIFDGVVLSHAEDEHLSAGTLMHEGKTSIRLGVKGQPNMTEELIVARDISLAAYAGTPLHFSHITSAGSVDMIRKARKKGHLISCDVAVAHLVFTDESLADFDSNYKLTPPLRSKADQAALWAGVADGTIDCIVSDHHPEDVERKDIEFEYAAQGMIQLQTMWSLLNMHAPEGMDTGRLISAVTAAPRRILKQTAIRIEAGSAAELTVFNRNETWTYHAGNNRSLSRNSPLLNTELKGRVLGTINKNQVFRNI